MKLIREREKRTDVAGGVEADGDFAVEVFR